MTDWGKVLIRSFGVLHLIFGVVGSLILVDATIRTARGAVHFGEFPFERHAYYVMTSINGLLVGALIVAGLWLLRLQRRGVVLSNLILSAEILYWLASALIPLALTMHGNRAAVIGDSIAAVGGIGDMGTNAQLLTAYPLVALVGLNVARRHLDRRKLWNTREPSPSR